MKDRLVYWLVAKLYNYLTNRDRDRAITFMNYGFAETGLCPHPGEGTVDPDIRRKGLYLKVVSKLEQGEWNWALADVLEVGSGRGGGAALLAERLAPKSYQGIDLSDKAVAFCRDAYSVPCLDFSQGKAESLPFPTNSFDLVLSVESSHCYPNLPKFINSAQRVLRPGGYLIIADFRRPDGIRRVSHDLLASGMEKVDEEDITSNVVLALQLDSAANLDLVRRYIPWWLHWFFRPFAGIENSSIHESFKSGDREYWIFVYQKRKQQSL